MGVGEGVAGCCTCVNTHSMIFITSIALKNVEVLCSCYGSMVL